jgi:hypothetical protein
MDDVQPISPWFSRASRALTAAARGLGLAAPSFRSPPLLAGVDRSLGRRPEGGAVVAVRLRGRSQAQIRADMVDGVLAANGIGPTSPGAAELRRALEEVVPLASAAGRAA